LFRAGVTKQARFFHYHPSSTVFSLPLDACLREVPPCGAKAGERVGVRVEISIFSPSLGGRGRFFEIGGSIGQIKREDSTD